MEKESGRQGWDLSHLPDPLGIFGDGMERELQQGTFGRDSEESGGRGQVRDFSAPEERGY